MIERFVTAAETRRDPIPILFQVKLSANCEPFAAVVRNEAGCAYYGRWGNLVLHAKGKYIAEYRHNSGTEGRARNR